MKDKKTIIFDLDGTLAIIDKRRIKAGSPTGKTPTPSKMDWDVFFDPDNIKLDEPVSYTHLTLPTIGCV